MVIINQRGNMLWPRYDGSGAWSFGPVEIWSWMRPWLCGLGLVEIKCPLNIAHDKPDDTNLEYLCAREDGVRLKPTHPYYTQVQCQMAVCGREWSDFFVYTKHGHHLERIVFNVESRSAVVVHLELILPQFIVSEHLTGIMKSMLEVGTIVTPLAGEKHMVTSRVR